MALCLDCDWDIPDNWLALEDLPEASAMGGRPLLADILSVTGDDMSVLRKEPGGMNADRSGTGHA